MKRKIFHSWYVFLFCMVVSCEKYEFQDSDLKYERKEIIKLLIGNWKLKNAYVNGHDSTFFLDQYIGGDSKVVFNRSNATIRDNVTTDIECRIFGKDSTIFFSGMSVEKRFMGTALSALILFKNEEENPFVNSIGPNSSLRDGYSESFYIRYLTAKTLKIIDIDQFDSSGNRITNLLIFEKL